MLLLFAAPHAKAKATVSFHRDVLPIFRTACVGCHSNENPVNGLVLVSYDSLMKGGKGGAAIVAGKSAESRLYKYLTGAIKPQMPPGGALKTADIDKIRQWIDAGAKTDAPLPEPDKKTRSVAKNAARTTPAVNSAGTAARSASPLTSPRRNVATPITALAFSPDGKTLAVGVYREVQFWDMEKKSLTKTWEGHGDAVNALVYTKDGKLLAAGSGVSGASGEIRLWNAAEGRETRTLGEHTDSITSLAFSPDSKRLASGSMDKSVKVWDVATGKAMATLREHSDAITGVGYTADGKMLASGSMDKSVKVWDANTFKRVYSVGAHEEPVTDLEFSPDGKTWLSSSADKSVRVWNFGAENSSLVRTLGGHTHTVLAATFSPDGKSIATASADKSVRLWNAANGGQTKNFTDPKDWVYALRFSPDSKHIAAGTWDGTLFLWNVADGKLEATLSTKP